MSHGMPTDEYVAIAMEQLKAGEFFVVSHAYNIVRIEQRYKMLRRLSPSTLLAMTPTSSTTFAPWSVRSWRNNLASS